MNKFRNFIEKFNLIIGYICGLGILAMGLMLAYEVVCRYCFNSPTVWAQETSVYLFTWTMLAGCAYTLMEGKHVRIDLVFEHFPKKIQHFLDAIMGCVGAVFCAVVAWQAGDMIISSLQHGKVSPTLLRVPMWIPQLSLFIGFGLLTLQFIVIVMNRTIELTGKANKSGKSSKLREEM